MEDVRLLKDDLKLKWRNTPSYYDENTNSIQAFQTLIASFLEDRHSNSLLSKKLSSKKLNAPWGVKPLEKIVKNSSDLQYILSNSNIIKNAVSIIEPSDHVGENNDGEGVRASSNIAYICRMVADCDSVLFPLWESGISNMDNLIEVLQNSRAIVVEGGHPSVSDSSTFDNSNVSLKELLLLSEKILLSRIQKSSPAIFICLGHQLVAQAHITLIKKAVDTICNKLSIVIEKKDYKYEALISLCNEIEKVGSNLQIVKNGSIVASGWDDPCFAVAKNEITEVGKCELNHFKHDGIHPSSDFKKLLIKHNKTSSEYNGIVEESISYEKNLELLMFHSDEVNQEAILFSNWAYSKLQDTLSSCSNLISISPLSWLLRLPSSVEILCSTSFKNKTLTEVAATCISYKDYQTKKIRRSFSFQFHPELLSDLREFHLSGKHDYDLFKNDDGVRMLMRVLYESVLE